MLPGFPIHHIRICVLPILENVVTWGLIGHAKSVLTGLQSQCRVPDPSVLIFGILFISACSLWLAERSQQRNIYIPLVPGSAAQPPRCKERSEECSEGA